MIIIDTALSKREKENNPIVVGIIGAGEMAKGLVNQIEKFTDGMTIGVLFNRNVEGCENISEYVGLKNPVTTSGKESIEKALKNGKTVLTDDLEGTIAQKNLDLVVDLTGSIEFSTRLFLLCAEHQMNLLSFNAELDASIGPLLKKKAKEAGIKYSVADGDQPGVTMNLFRYVKSMGFKPLLCGNVKGMMDYYRNPTTQEAFAESWGMSAYMATNFADGTKVAFEQACIANATGMQVAKRGMYCYSSQKHVDELTGLFDIEELEAKGGIVDIIVGAKPGPGVFVYATTDDEHSRKYLDYAKLGKGPLYSFYVPYHLLFFEIPSSIARMIDFDDDIISSKNGPCVEVIAVAKKDMRKGDVIDGIGGYCTYGICENFQQSRKENLLPMALANRSVLLQDVKKDQVLSFDMVDTSEHDKIYDLWFEQLEHFGG